MSSAPVKRHSRTLAHHGVLFDEFTEFRRDAIEGLRQPLEDVRLDRLAGMDTPPQERMRFLGGS